MRTTAVLLSLGLFSTAVAGALPAEASAQYGADARIWVDNDRDSFRHGDRLRVRFSTSANSYVAVVHVDPDGYLDFVYPASPWDDEFVRAGRTYTLDGAGWGNGLPVRSGSGIGYLYVIASPVPLDYSNFRAGRGFGWDWSYAGRRVSGDPFWAMEQLTRMLVPGWGNVPYAVDYYTYYVGGIHAYPRYACSRYDGGWGWGYSPGWTSYYGACGRLDRFLIDNPYYFDSRRYRGDRWRYYRDYRDTRDWDPRYGYKEDPRSGASPSVSRPQSRPADAAAGAAPRTARPVAPSSRPAQRAEPERSTENPAPARATPRPTERPEPAARPRPQEREEAPAARPRTEPRDPEPAARPRPEPREPARAAPAERSRPEPRATRATSARSAPAPASRGAASASRDSRPADRGSSTATPRSRRAD